MTSKLIERINALELENQDLKKGNFSHYHVINSTNLVTGIRI